MIDVPENLSHYFCPVLHISSRQAVKFTCYILKYEYHKIPNDDKRKMHHSWEFYKNI